jgi:hypothetical protein
MPSLSLEQRIDRLESMEDIKMLKAVYCDLCDRGYDSDGLAALFTEDASWDGGSFGRYEGREAIRAFFKSISGYLVFAAHLVMNPVIVFVDDDTANGKWRLFEPCSAKGENGADSMILLAAYDDVYVRRNGKWLHKSVRLQSNFFEPLSKGWAHSAVQ